MTKNTDQLNIMPKSFNPFIDNKSHKMAIKNVHGDDILLKCKDISFIHKTHAQDQWEVGLTSGRTFSIDKPEIAQELIEAFKGE